jgi:hypothetical protein
MRDDMGKEEKPHHLTIKKKKDKRIHTASIDACRKAAYCRHGHVTHKHYRLL